MRSQTVALAAGLGLWAACSGSRSQIKIGPTPEKVTRGPLAGPLCTTDRCTCRQGAEDVGVPDGGRKRFELRLASAQPLWVTLPGHQLYKSPETAEACFYVDLAPGQHPLELRASNPEGVSVSLAVQELGVPAKTWYSTFAFTCGHPGVCSFSDLDAAKASYRDVDRNLHDACGSTKIKGLTWDHGKAPDGAHPSELLVRLALDVYKFTPDKPSGDPSCGAGEGKRGASAGEPEPE
ncbi:MAG: hypothetical protein M3680_08620 [Myxococcota bacterium]|nr:hypothetical protein [Myxococcota bacterium]